MILLRHFRNRQFSHVRSVQSYNKILYLKRASSAMLNINQKGRLTTMEFRKLGKTGFNIREVSLGTWQLGGKWGAPFDEKDALDTLEAAYDHGVNFFDTADGYQDGMSEKVVGQFIKRHPDVHYSTKVGRKEMPLTMDHFSPKAIRR